ncbi:MAG: lasso peptide biosynthesis B2 protein [Pseudomonadota bacterium]
MAETTGLWHRANSFIRHTTLRQKFAAPILYVVLGLARAMVLSMPFRSYAPLLGELAQDNAACASPSASEANRAMRIGYLIEGVAQFTPWNSNCLAQAIVASLCLRLLKIGYSVHFGVAKSGDGAASLEAHSWVMAGEYPVTGFEEAQGMTCLRTFRLEPL